MISHSNQKTTDDFMTEQDKKALLVAGSKLKKIQLELNRELDFTNSNVSYLTSHPIDNFATLNDRYEKNYLNVTIEDKIDALKTRYEKYEVTMKEHLKSQGINYQRIHLNTLKTDETFIVTGFAKSIEEDTKINFNDFSIDCLDPNGEPYNLVCMIDPSDCEAEGFGLGGFQLFPMKLITVQGSLNEDQELEITKIFSTPSYANTAPVGNSFTSHTEILAFAGPYTLDGSNFTAFEPMLERIVEATPSLVILMGPFYAKSTQKGEYPDPVYTNYKKKEVDYHF